MLTEELKRAVEAECHRFHKRQSACIEALLIVQEASGWISDELLLELADFLEMTPEELDGVATFYNHIYRKPVGRHVINICDSVTCWIMGYESLREHLSRKLGIGMGQTSADGVFTMVPVQCLGVCENAPAMMIDDEVYTDLTPERIDQIIDRYKKESV